MGVRRSPKEASRDAGKSKDFEVASETTQDATAEAKKSDIFIGAREVDWCLRVDDRSEETLDGRRSSRSDESRQCRRSAERANLEPFSGDVIAGSGDWSRVVQTPGEGPLGQRPMVPGERERTQRNDELRLEVGEKTAEGLVVKAKRAPPATQHGWVG